MDAALEATNTRIECDVILRTCSEVYAAHPHKTEKGENYPRMTGADVSKSEIILHSLNSLIKTMNNCSEDLRLVIVDDHSSAECLESMRKLLRLCRFPTEIISIEDRGNGASLKAAYEWALKNGRRVLFFAEDDYLYDLTCMDEMVYVYRVFREKLKHEVALFPCDYPDNYMKPKYSNIPSHIVLGKKRHWRTIVNSTCTFLCSNKLLKDYWKYFEPMTRYESDESVSEETTYNKLWKMPYIDGGGAFLFSPIPSLSVHLQYATDFEDQRSPFINWKEWWDSSDPRIQG